LGPMIATLQSALLGIIASAKLERINDIDGFAELFKAVMDASKESRERIRDALFSESKEAAQAGHTEFAILRARQVICSWVGGCCSTFYLSREK
jgi:hypothetical protein